MEDKMKIGQFKRVIVLGGIIMSFLAGSAVRGYPYEGSGGEGKWRKERWEENADRVHKKLNLTPEQENQLKAHRESHRKQMQTLREQLKAKRDQIRAELQKSDFNIEEVQKTHGELKALKSQVEDLRLQGILEVREILTPEQFNKFNEMKNDGKMKQNKKGFLRDKKGDRGNQDNWQGSY